MTDNKQYPPLPDFEEVEQHIYGVSRDYIPRGMLEPIHELMRAYVDADRAMRAVEAAPAAQDTARLDWLTFNISGKALRDIGVDWSGHGDARRAIDAAKGESNG